MGVGRPWGFVADMNFDGIVTISDVWLWCKWLYFYPGDLVLRVTMDGFPGLARFLELTEGSYGGVVPYVLSLVLWPMASAALAGIVGQASELLDRIARRSTEFSDRLKRKFTRKQ